MVADGPLFYSAKFVAAKFAEVPGDICSVIDSENYMHVNSLEYPASDYAQMILINSQDPNVVRIADTVNNIVKRQGRDVLVFADKEPVALGITEKVDYCHMEVAQGEFSFLTSLYAFIPSSILAGYRMTTMGEPMFRGGFDMEIFSHSYFSPEVILD